MPNLKDAKQILLSLMNSERGTYKIPGTDKNCLTLFFKLCSKNKTSSSDAKAIIFFI